MRSDCLTRWYAPRNGVERTPATRPSRAGKAFAFVGRARRISLSDGKKPPSETFALARDRVRVFVSHRHGTEGNARSLPLHEPESVNSLSCTGNRSGRLQWNFTSWSSLSFAQVEVCMQSKYVSQYRLAIYTESF